MLSTEESAHYSRHLDLEKFGLQSQLKLKKAKVLVVGAGGLGCPALIYLTAAGIGTLGIIDGDNVEASNLQRQILFQYNDIGKNKAKTASDRLSLLNPHIKLSPYETFITQENAINIIGDYDIVIDGSDNIATKELINDACVIKNKPLIFGAIYKFEGQLSVFNYNNGPTYRCLFPENKDIVEKLDCSSIGVLGVLPGIIGNLQAIECIKVIAGIGNILSGRVLLYNGLEQSFSQISLKRSNKANIKKLANYKTPICSSYTLSTIEVKEKLTNNPKVQFVDVREKEEFESYNIGALNLPLSKLDQLLDQLEKSNPVIVHCKSGQRSIKAIDILKKNSFKEVYNMKGGIMNWS